ncbi:MAG: hypothetical protein O9308_03980 [Beijerinckiaceae bacterium]|nr:hypothetical protein [Beijerinckiaceae bacterium]
MIAIVQRIMRLPRQISLPTSKDRPAARQVQGVLLLARETGMSGAARGGSAAKAGMVSKPRNAKTGKAAKSGNARTDMGASASAGASLNRSGDRVNASRMILRLQLVKFEQKAARAMSKVFKRGV